MSLSAIAIAIRPTPAYRPAPIPRLSIADGPAALRPSPLDGPLADYLDARRALDLADSIVAELDSHDAPNAAVVAAERLIQVPASDRLHAAALALVDALRTVGSPVEIDHGREAFGSMVGTTFIVAVLDGSALMPLVLLMPIDRT